jgi:hypothetical protein
MERHLAELQQAIARADRQSVRAKLSELTASDHDGHEVQPLTRTQGANVVTGDWPKRVQSVIES